MNNLKMENNRYVETNIKKISKIFPNVVVETEKGLSIDFESLKNELSNDIIEGTKEKFQLNWPGKNKAKITTNKPTTATLRPCIDKSVNFNDSKNIYIEGDNLEVLKILQESYLNKIKCIYIDPPYNTGNDFIYNDTFKKRENEELLESGQIDEDGNKLIANNETNGRFHSDWLTMMYSRLKLARNLLKDDGAIFISIDDNELNNLRKICDEIFGENNFVAICPRKTRGSATTKSDAEIQKLNDYVLIYWKDKSVSAFKLKLVGEKEYPHEDERGKYYTVLLQDNGPHGTKTARPNLYYPIYQHSDGSLSLEKENDEDIEFLPSKHKNDDGTWMWSKPKFETDKKDLCIKNSKVYIKHYFNPNEDQNQYRRENNWIDGFLNTKGTLALNDVFDEKGIFDNPKPIELIKKFIDMTTSEDDIILDFFSGSGTTGQAVLELNKEDNSKRTFILIQIPEEIPKDRYSYSLGYRTICDIGEARLKKYIDKENIKDGFRIYKLDSSNMKDIYYKPSDLTQLNILDLASNIKEDRNPEDLLIQVMLDLGLTLDLKINSRLINNNKVYFVENNSLVACFDDKIEISILDDICKIKPMRVVFKDVSFKTDKEKINLQERIKKLSPDTDINIL